jgi:hypothetical protein
MLVTLCPPIDTCFYAHEFGRLQAGSSQAQTFTVTNVGDGSSEALFVKSFLEPTFATSNDTCIAKVLAPNGAARSR